MQINYAKTTQYICAILLIASSIIMAFYQVLDIDDVASGTLMYIAQAFLLAGSIFGLDYYIKRIKDEYKATSKRNKKQQSTESSQNEEPVEGLSEQSN